MSYMSQPEVIAASRNFVCVRLMTYESAAEAEVLKSMWRQGAPLENTLFAILDSSGRPLTRGVRSPGFFYSDARALAGALNDVASHYSGRTNPKGLPVIATVRLGLNVAACDKRPLTIVLADSEQDRRALEANLAPMAWSTQLVGKVCYASGGRNDLRGISGSNLARGYLFVAPNEFGTTGAIIAQLQPNASAAELKNALQFAVDSYRPSYTDHHDHVRMGRQQGIHWDTAIPITDQQALRAEQGR